MDCSVVGKSISLSDFNPGYLMLCSYCNKEFTANSRCKECSLKCRILKGHSKNSQCWDWDGKIGKNGYGQIRENQKHSLVHRISYLIFKGEIPAGMNVCHTCDNRKCCNPDHLWIGSAKDNSQDAKMKGRLPDQRGRKHTEETKAKFKFRPHSDRRGEKHHLCKLTEKDVLEIREMLKKNLTQKCIANKYGIDPSAISNIKTGKSWSHI